jgi:tRNA uridine 5-carboxymethylaminomethyl modification enzyme
VHEILRNDFEKSPLFNGTIQSIGPRYCPSIEDKINRFAERDRHQIFVEPEGWTTAEVYVNGFSSSLPLETQYNALRKIPGFENVKIYRPGYAIEYDFFFPTQLKPSLETKAIKGLFFAGQINGTTGYEEAACQGLMAGYNAHAYVTNKEPLVLKRHQSYIGVLIDDLVNKGTEEPYRMFTSRAEYRLLLRQDNADQRLMPIAYERRALDPKHYHQLQLKQQNIKSITNIIATTKVTLDDINPYLLEQNFTPIKEKTTLHKLILRPELNIKSFLHINDINILLSEFNDEELMQAEILLKYEHYLKREEELAHKLTKMDKLKIPLNIDYEQFQSISAEGRQKLKTIQPETIGQASRISGVSPSDVSILLIQLGK